MKRACEGEKKIGASATSVSLSYAMVCNSRERCCVLDD